MFNMKITKTLIFFLSVLFLVSCSKESREIGSLKDAETATIGAMTGSTGEQHVRTKFPNAKLKSFDDVMDAVAALKSDQIEAIVTAYSNAINICKHNPELKMLKEVIEYENTAIAIAKGKEDLLAQVNTVIHDLKTDGTLKDMRQRWFKEDFLPYKTFSFNLPSSGEPLKIGVSATREPFCFKDEKREVSGHDGELARRIGEKLKKPIEFVDMKFSALIPALQSGKIDMIITGMSATKERMKTVNFTESYFDNAQILIVKKSGKEFSAANNSLWDRVSLSFYNNLILEERYLLILDGLKTTLVISLLTTIFGTLLGGLVCLMRMSKNKIVQSIARIYISVLRGTPVLVVLMIIFYVVFASVNIDPVIVAVVAFGLNFAAYVSEMFRTGIEGVDSGQSEAGIALGFTKVKTFLYIILPQAIRRIMPVYKGELISLVKMTSIVGYIAVQDLTKASDIIRSRTFDAFFPLIFVAVLYFVIAWLLLAILGYLEKVTDPKLKSIKLRGQS